MNTCIRPDMSSMEPYLEGHGDCVFLFLAPLGQNIALAILRINLLTKPLDRQHVYDFSSMPSNAFGFSGSLRLWALGIHCCNHEESTWEERGRCGGNWDYKFRGLSPKHLACHGTLEYHISQGLGYLGPCPNLR